MAWLECCVLDGIAVLRLPGTPGGRWDLKPDRTPWVERGLRMISTERPGFGASTRLPGRRFHEHADDLAAILDCAGVERVYLIGGSGAAPHILSFLSRYPERSIAATISNGAAPLVPEEVDEMMEENRSEWYLVRSGDRRGLERAQRRAREELMERPLSIFSDLLEGASRADRISFEKMLGGPGALAAVERSLRESLSTEENLQAWIDETFALVLDWDDIDFTAIRASITWYHGRADVAAPFSAAERLVGTMPSATLVDVGVNAGHVNNVVSEGARLDELISRG